MTSPSDNKNSSRRLSGSIS